MCISHVQILKMRVHTILLNTKHPNKAIQVSKSQDLKFKPQKEIVPNFFMDLFIHCKFVLHKLYFTIL